MCTTREHNHSLILEYALQNFHHVFFSLNHHPVLLSMCMSLPYHGLLIFTIFWHSKSLILIHHLVHSISNPHLQYIYTSQSMITLSLYPSQFPPPFSQSIHPYILPTNSSVSLPFPLTYFMLALHTSTSGSSSSSDPLFPPSSHFASFLLLYVNIIHIYIDFKIHISGTNKNYTSVTNT